MSVGYISAKITDLIQQFLPIFTVILYLSHIIKSSRFAQFFNIYVTFCILFYFSRYANNNISDISRPFSSDPPKKKPNKKPGIRALKKRLIPGFFSFMPSAGNIAKRTISQ